MTIMFDSSHLGNPTIFTARPFAAGIDPAPAVEPIAWPTHHTLGRNPNPPTDDDDSTDYTPVFHPTPEEEKWAAANLNEDATDYDVIPAPAEELDADSDAEFFGHYEPTTADWSEYEAWACNGAWGGHPDRVDPDA